jgi:hypothetical protein
MIAYVFAASPLDVRKGSAFPALLLFDRGGSAFYSEA